MSQQERISWVSLVVNLVIGGWYFSRVFTLPAGADLLGPRMAGFALMLIVAAVVVGVASEVVLRTVQRAAARDATDDVTALDERDTLINLKATRNAYVGLSIVVIAVLGQIAMLEWTARWLRSARLRAMPAPDTVFGQIFTGPLTAPLMAQLLLLALTLGGITVYASRIFYYRRGW